MNATFKTVMLWMSLLVVVFLAWHFAQFQKKETPVKFSEFMAQVEAGDRWQEVTITGNEVKGHFDDRQAGQFRTASLPMGYDKPRWTRCWPRTSWSTYQQDQTPTWANMLISWAPLILLLIGFWVFFHAPDADPAATRRCQLRQVEGEAARQPAEEGRRSRTSPASTKPRRSCRRSSSSSKEPQKFQKLGGRIPKGVLLMGPPGNGQDAPGPGHRRRGERALLLDLGFRLRGDVRRRRRLALCGTCSSREEERPLHHLHRRDRRSGPASRRGPRAAGTMNGSRP